MMRARVPSMRLVLKHMIRRRLPRTSIRLESLGVKQLRTYLWKGENVIVHAENRWTCDRKPNAST
jgi:hypothetical protein